MNNLLTGPTGVTTLTTKVTGHNKNIDDNMNNLLTGPTGVTTLTTKITGHNKNIDDNMNNLLTASNSAAILTGTLNGNTDTLNQLLSGVTTSSATLKSKLDTTLATNNLDSVLSSSPLSTINQVKSKLDSHLAILNSPTVNITDIQNKYSSLSSGLSGAISSVASLFAVPTTVQNDTKTLATSINTSLTSPIYGLQAIQNNIDLVPDTTIINHKAYAAAFIGKQFGLATNGQPLYNGTFIAANTNSNITIPVCVLGNVINVGDSTFAPSIPNTIVNNIQLSSPSNLTLKAKNNTNALITTPTSGTYSLNTGLYCKYSKTASSYGGNNYPCNASNEVSSSDGFCYAPFVPVPIN